MILIISIIYSSFLREKETNKQRQRQKDGDRGTETERQRQIDRQTERKRQIETIQMGDRQTNRQTTETESHRERERTECFPQKKLLSFLADIMK